MSEQVQNQGVAKKDPHPFKGTGRRPQFHALWHLCELGVVDAKDSFLSKAWKKVEDYVGSDKRQQVKVAIIDTLPAFTHPNLADAIDPAAICDFTLSAAGKPVQAKDRRHWDYGAHGTAVAGLIAARPTEIQMIRPARFDGDGGQYSGIEDKHPESVSQELPYCGINPFAQIIPIVVSASPDPAMIVAALKHANKIKPDVVVIADSWEVKGSAYPAKEKDDDTQHYTDYATPIGTRDGLKTWEDAEAVLRELCTATFVFCAAGNEPRDRMVYPAELSTAQSGPWAVGACDFKGKDLTYTPQSDAVRDGTDNPRLVNTLSSEHPRFDNKVQKLDPWAKLDEELNLPDYLFMNEFPAQDIVATDVPGPAGYNPSNFNHLPSKKNDKHIEIASLFCRFAGTSASTALAAGLVSLAIALERADGKEPGQTKKGKRPYKGPDAGTSELFTLDKALALVQSGFPRHLTEPDEDDSATQAP